MHGYQLTFFTQQDCRYAGLPLGEWLVQEAKRLGVSGATMVAATEGFGQDCKLHSAHFFELADQPVEVMLAVTPSEADQLFQRLREEHINVFFIKMPIEFGMTADTWHGA